MNLGQLRTAVQNKGYGTDTAAIQTEFINEGYRQIHGKERWPFLEKQDTSLSTVSGTSAYTLPFTDWRNLDAVRIEQASLQNYLNMKYKSVQQFRELEHIDRDISTPVFWSFYANQLHFYPVPDGVYTVRIDYIYQPPDLTADTDVPVIPLAYHDVLVWYAVKSMAARERDWIMLNFATQEYETLLKRFEEEYFMRQRQTSSHVRSSGYWDTQLPYPFIHDV